MIKLHNVLKQTCFGIATGLFTGGIVTTIVSPNSSLVVLLYAYVPSLVAYEFFVMLTVIENEKDAKKNKALVFVNGIMVIIICFIFIL